MSTKNQPEILRCGVLCKTSRTKTARARFTGLCCIANSVRCDSCNDFYRNKIVQNVVSKYKCPKCDCDYCSLACYKQHGENCVEMFYNENVVETLKSMKSSKEERQEMQNILWRVKETEEAQYRQMQLLSEKLDTLDLDDPHLFDKLSKEEQETFARMISGNEFSSIVELWKPWWTQSSKVIQLPTETGTMDNGDDEFSPMPSVPSAIPPLTSIYKKEPSPDMNYNLIDLLYCYVYCQRIFDGQPYEEIIEYMAHYSRVSSVVINNKSFSSMTLVVSTIFEKMIEIKERYPIEFLFSLFEDIERILESKVFVVAALYDLYSIFTYFLEKFPHGSKDLKSNSLRPKIIEAGKKKIYFFFLWANQLEDHAFGLQLVELKAEMLSKRLFFETNAQPRNNATDSNLQKNLIQELK